MAGIGFELRKILSEDTYTSHIKAYVYAAIISSGPWLMTVIAISVIGRTVRVFLSDHEADIMGATINYVYAFSIIMTGILQMVVTRYLADRLYRDESHMVLPIFNTTWIVTLVTQAPVAAVFLYHCDLPFLYCLIAFLLYLCICSMWICMIFLSAAKDYQAIVTAFLVGTGFSVLCAWYLAPTQGLVGVLGGYTAGQLVILFWLILRLMVEFPSDRYVDRDMFSAFGPYLPHVLIGFFYNLGVWVDKFMFWFSESGYQITGPLYANRLYDNSIFMAYLATIPAFALFLIRIETDFYEKYKTYYATIIHKASRSKILRERDELVGSIRQGLGQLIKVQGAITLCMLVLTPFVIEALNFSYQQYSIMRIGFIAAYLQTIFLILLVVLLYFDFRKEALISTVVFLCTNSVFTLVSLKLGFANYGYGYFASCLVSVPVAYFFLDRNLNRLEYLTFMNQPISG